MPVMEGSSANTLTKNVRIRLNLLEMKSLLPQMINLIHNNPSSTETPPGGKVLYFSALKNEPGTTGTIKLNPSYFRTEGNDPTPEYRTISSVNIGQIWIQDGGLYQYYPYLYVDPTKLQYVSEKYVYANGNMATSTMPFPRKRGFFYFLTNGTSGKPTIRIKHIGVDASGKNCTGIAFYANTTPIFKAWLDGYSVDDYKTAAYTGNGQNFLLDDFNNQWFLNQNYNAFSSDGKIGFLNQYPDTAALDFYTWIPLTPYTAPTQKPIVTPVPDPFPPTVDAEPEYLEQRKALQAGINLKVVDTFHRDTMGNGELRGKENIINNNVKDEDTAFRIGQIAIQKTKRNLDINVLAPPMFQLEPGKYLSMPISAKNMTVFEPIDSLKFEISADKSDYGITLKGIGKDNS